MGHTATGRGLDRLSSRGGEPRAGFHRPGLRAQNLLQFDRFAGATAGEGCTGATAPLALGAAGVAGAAVATAGALFAEVVVAALAFVAFRVARPFASVVASARRRFVGASL
jgi:hypothetical protein